MINLPSTIDRIKELLADESIEPLKEDLNSYHSADLADILQELKEDDRIQCFKLIEIDKAAEIIEYLSPQLQVEILGAIDEEKASKIITMLPHDAAADVLGDMADDETETYLDRLPQKFSDELRELLTYDEETAGGLMNPRVMTVNLDMTAQQVLDYVRVRAEEDNVDLYYIYVVDKKNHLLGVVSLRGLLTSPKSAKIADIMTSDIVKLHIDDRQGYIADEFMKYQFNALPVVDLYNRLKGVVTWDDIQEVVEEETTDEIYASSGITSTFTEDEILKGSLLTSVRARVPWLFVTLIGEFFAVNVAKHYNETIHILPIVAIFMPLLAGLAGNIGTQSITLMVRGLSTGQITMSGAITNVLRETGIGLIIGIIFGVMVTLFTWGWQHSIDLGIVVGLSMAINMTLATLIGTITPFAMKKMNVDPAVASGPVIATTIDVIGLAVYFSLATFYLIKVS